MQREKSSYLTRDFEGNAFLFIELPTTSEYAWGQTIPCQLFFGLLSLIIYIISNGYFLVSSYKTLIFEYISFEILLIYQGIYEVIKSCLWE